MNFIKIFSIIFFLCSYGIVHAGVVNMSDLKTKNVKSDSSLIWQQFGPGMSGNNKSAFWHPTDKNYLYISPNMGNSYRSTDAGKTYQTTLVEDGPGYKSLVRGPEDVTSIDFSRQDDSYGFATDEKNRGLFFSDNKGAKWVLHTASEATFNKIYLACVAVDPQDDNVWFVGAGQMRDMAHVRFSKAEPHGTLIDANSLGKIWKSVDKGETWTLSNSGLHPKAQVETILVDPAHSNIVYATTNYGFYKSTNGGASWSKKSAGLDNDVIRSFAYYYNKADDKLIMYALVNRMYKETGSTITDSCGGVFKSSDRGESWVNMNGNLAINMKILGTYAAVKKQFYKNMDLFFSITNSDVKYDLPISYSINFNQIAVDPNDSNNVFLVNEYSNGSPINCQPGSIYRTKDGGKHWFVTFRNGTNWSSGAHKAYWESRGNPTGSNVTIQYLSRWMDRDGYDRKGCNFVRFNAGGSIIHTQMAKISLMSYDGGDTWVDIDDIRTTPGEERYVGAGNSNLPGHGFFQDPHLPNRVFCAAGENALWVTNNEGDNARQGAQGATSYTFTDAEQSLSSYVVSPNDTNIRFATFFRQDKRGKVLKSIDAGKTWVEWGTAIPAWSTTGSGGDQSVHQMNLMIDPDDENYMYFNVPKNSKDIELVGNSVTGWGVHRSIDGGKNWTEINMGLPSSKDVTAIAFDPHNSKILYAAVQKSGGGLFKSTDRGEHWSEVYSTISIKGTQGINDIHFAKDGKVYITAGHKNSGKDEGGLYVSDDNMISWRKIFDFPWVFRVETALYNPDVILISTLGNANIDFKNPGTYLSKDAGATWIKCNLGNGQADRINDIAIDNYREGIYYASTRGSGWYVAKEQTAELTVKDSISLISPPSSMIQNDSLTFTVRYVASKDRDVVVILNSPSGKWLANKKKTVSIGKNVIHLTIMLDTLPEVATGYTISAVVRDKGAPSSDVIVKDEAVFAIEPTTIIGNLKSLNEDLLQLYPNPAVDYVTFSTKIKGQILLVNSDGNVIRKIRKGKVLVRDLIPSLYYIVIKCGNEIEVVKPFYKVK